MPSLIPWKRRSEERGSGALAERPRDVLVQMRRELDTLFDRFFTGWPMAGGGDWPVAGWGFDVDDTEKEIVVHTDSAARASPSRPRAKRKGRAADTRAAVDTGPADRAQAG